jgi:RNA polymerase sigma factor (sigma-70 family)
MQTITELVQVVSPGRTRRRYARSVSETTPTDFALLDAWCAGDRKAGGVLVQRHFSTLYGFLRNKLRDDIDDLIQRTFLACVEHRDRFRRESSFRTYLFTIARNELLQHFRKTGRRGEHVDFHLVSVADLGTSPSQLVARKAEHKLLLEAMRRIPLDHQIVLELFYWENLSGSELGRVLEVPEGTVRTRIRRARQALAERMTELAGSADIASSTIDNLSAWAASMRALLREGANG